MINLIQLGVGKSAVIVSIEAGLSVLTRLNNLGIREGIVIKKVTGLFKRGPVVVKAGRTQVALGNGMASKVMVKTI